MNYCWRFFLSVFISFVLTFVTFTGNSQAGEFTQLTAKDFFKLGVEKMQENDYQEGLKYFTEAIELNPDLAAGYGNRCLAYLQLQDYHNAMVDCTKAINITPKNSEAYLNRGLAHYRLGNYSAAISDNISAIALNRNDFRAYYNRGIAKASLGNYQEAIEDYNLALSQISQNSQLFLVADIYNDRGLAKMQLANLPAASLDFSTAIRLNADDYRAYFNRACACGRRGDELGAIRDFSQVIRLNPTYPQAYANRGIARHRLGYHEAAIADMQKAAEYYGHQGHRVAYEKTLNLIKSLQQQIPNVAEVALL